MKSRTGGEGMDMTAWRCEGIWLCGRYDRLRGEFRVNILGVNFVEKGKTKISRKGMRLNLDVRSEPGKTEVDSFSLII